jgi:prevent-host-death family protein
MIEYTELSAADARKRLSDLIHRVSTMKEWIVLTRHGKQVAVATPLEEFEYFEGPGETLSPQGLETFIDITLWEPPPRGRIWERQAAYQVDNKIRRVTSAELRDNFSDVLSQVSYGKRRIVVTRRDYDLFVLIPPEAFERYQILEDLEEEYDAKIIEQMERDGELEDTIPWEDLKRELDLD